MMDIRYGGRYGGALMAASAAAFSLAFAPGPTAPHRPPAPSNFKKKKRYRGKGRGGRYLIKGVRP